jgi:hypothetical protein
MPIQSPVLGVIMPEPADRTDVPRDMRMLAESFAQHLPRIGPTAPESPPDGTVWYDTRYKMWKTWTGSRWKRHNLSAVPGWTQGFSGSVVPAGGDTPEARARTYRPIVFAGTRVPEMTVSGGLVQISAPYPFPNAHVASVPVSGVQWETVSVQRGSNTMRSFGAQAVIATGYAQDFGVFRFNYVMAGI